MRSSSFSRKPSKLALAAMLHSAQGQLCGAEVAAAAGGRTQLPTCLCAED